MGRRDDPHVHVRVPAPPTRRTLRSEHPQQLGLEVERQVADLVEEDRPAVGQLERPDFRGDGAGERALLMTEQLALDQRRPGSRRS